MKSSEWVRLIKEEFGISRSRAKVMYHIMVEYYKMHCREE